MKTMARLEPEHLSFSSPMHFRPLHPHIRKATFLIYTGSCKRKKIAIIYPSPPPHYARAYIQEIVLSAFL